MGVQAPLNGLIVQHEVVPILVVAVLDGLLEVQLFVVPFDSVPKELVPSVGLLDFWVVVVAVS